MKGSFNLRPEGYPGTPDSVSGQAISTYFNTEEGISLMYLRNLKTASVDLAE